MGSSAVEATLTVNGRTARVATSDASFNARERGDARVLTIGSLRTAASESGTSVDA